MQLIDLRSRLRYRPITVRALRGPLFRPLSATVLVATGGVLPGFLTGALGVRIRADLQFGEAGLGFAIGLSFLAAAACSALFGSTAERLGPVRSMRSSSVASAASAIALAVVARSLASLTAVLVIAGIANAMTQPATNLYITRVVPPGRHGTAFAIKQAAIPGATLLGGLAVPTVALTVGWRWAYVIAGGVALGGGLLATEADDHGESVVRPTGKRDQSLGTLALLGAGVGLGALAAASLGSFGVSAFTEAGFGEGAAGLATSIGSALVVLVRLRLGVWSDRTVRAHLPVVGAMVLIGALGWAVMAAMTPAALIVGGLLAYTFGWGWAGLFNVAIARANPNAPAAASGVTQTGTYLGVAIGPFVFGLLAEHVGYDVAWTFAAGAAVLAAMTISFGARLGRVHERGTVRHMSDATDRVKLLIDGFDARVQAAPTEAWSGQSPCTDWTARDVVAHVANNMLRFGGAIAGTTHPPVADDESAPDAWARAKAAFVPMLDSADLSQVINGPFGPMPAEQLIGRVLSTDILVHTWDLARAVGGDESLPADIVEGAYSGLKPMDAMLRQSGVFGPKVDAPEGADVQTEFLAFLGRTA